MITLFAIHTKQTEKRLNFTFKPVFNIKGIFMREIPHRIWFYK